MTFSLYAAIVPSYRQILGAVIGMLNKAEAFCATKGVPAVDIVGARLAEDMLPFAYQVKSTAVHSLGAIHGVRKGIFSPDTATPPQDFAALKTMIAETLAALEADSDRTNDVLVVCLIDDSASLYSARRTCRNFRLDGGCAHLWMASYVLASQGSVRQ